MFLLYRFRYNCVLFGLFGEERFHLLELEFMFPRKDRKYGFVINLKN